MSTLLALVILVVIVVVAIWLINQIPFPAGLQIIRFLLIAVVVILALMRLFKFL